jgi:hypothetical protein
MISFLEEQDQRSAAPSLAEAEAGEDPASVSDFSAVLGSAGKATA